MNKLILLLKLNMNEEMSLSISHHEKDKKRRNAIKAKRIAMILFGILAVVAFYQLGNLMVRVGLAEAIPIIGYMAGSIITLVVTVLKTNETLAGKKDAEFLMALPVGSFLQVFCIFLRLYLWNVLYVAMCNVPMIVSYGMYVKTSSAFWIYWTLGIFLTALPITGIAAILGTILALILAPVKKANFIYSCIILGMFTALGLLVVVLGMRVGELASIGTSSAEIVDFISQNYRFGRIYQLGVVGCNIVWFLFLVFISGIWNVFLLLFLAVCYQEVVPALRSPGKYMEYAYKTQHQHKVQKALLHRQWQQWIHSRSYMVSTLLGPIIAILISIVIAIKGVEANVGLQMAIPFFLSAFVGSGCTTYCSLSMESRTQWIMNTIPMDRKVLYMSKIRMNLYITIPFVIICGGLLALGFHTDIVMSVLYILIPVIYAIISAVWGMFIDSKFADYSMDSEDMILRQSSSFYFGWLPGVLLPATIGMLLLL